MNRLLLIIVAVLCTPAFTHSVQACQCREYGTPICARFWRSDAVFVGRVVDIQPLKKVPDDVYTYVVASFAMKESFRGVSGRRIGVAVATNTLCDPKFEKGKSYLVYATLHEATKQFFTGMCTGTGEVDGTDDSVKRLRKLRQREVPESISGRIVSNGDIGVPGITVEIIGKDKTLKLTTGEYGEFSISPSGAGSFTVRVSVPYAAQLLRYSYDLDIRRTQTESVSTFEYDVTLEKSECNYLELEVAKQVPHFDRLSRSIHSVQGTLISRKTIGSSVLGIRTASAG